jgi:hypothetical protein
VLFVLRLVS